MITMRSFTKIGLITILTFSFAFANAQTLTNFNPKPTVWDRIYVKAGMSMNRTISDVSSDPNGYYNQGHFFDSAFRMDLGFEFNKRVAFEIGYMRENLWLTRTYNVTDALGLQRSPLTLLSSSSASITFWNLRMNTNFSFWKERIKIVPGVAYVAGFTFAEGAQGGSSTNIAGSNNTLGFDFNEETTWNSYNRGLNHFIEVGASIEMKIIGKLSFVGGGRMIHGSKRLAQLDIEYFHSENFDTGEVQVFTYGSVIAYDLGLKFDF